MPTFDDDNMPVGFGMELAQSPASLKAYSALDDAERASILERSRKAATRDEMRSIIESLIKS